MLEFSIANLVTPELTFEIPSSFAKWELARFGKYDNAVLGLDEGKCANTY